MIDPNRYALITQEYRFAEVSSVGPAPIYARAKVMDLESNFRDMAKLAAVCAQISAVVGKPRRRLELILSGTTHIGPDSFVGAVPVIQVNIPSLEAYGNYAMTRAVIDEDQDQTVVEAWGG